MAEIYVKENQDITIPLLWFGEETDLSYTLILDGKAARARVFGLLLGKETQNLKLRINVVHNHPHTTSEVIVRSALTDRANVHFEGMVTIKPGAKGTHAWLAAHILLLSNKAKGLAIPSLEILENDIKAGHATTVGKIHDLELFYLMSRGISNHMAKKLIVEGFLQHMLELFPTEVAAKAKKELIRYAID